jgi:hypothetical protein
VLFLNMTLAIVFSREARQEVLAHRMRTGERRGWKRGGVGASFMPFQVVLLSKSDGMVLATAFWTLVWSDMLRSAMLTMTIVIEKLFELHQTKILTFVHRALQMNYHNWNIDTEDFQEMQF